MYYDYHPRFPSTPFPSWPWPSQGWLCPVCGNVYAPGVVQCLQCAKGKPTAQSAEKQDAAN